VLNYDEIDVLAERYSASDGYDRPVDRVFGMLVDVADRYLTMLEEMPSDEAAPFFGGTTPLEATLRGLAENLEMKRDGTLEQHRT
jgi:hypothetical protein